MGLLDGLFGRKQRSRSTGSEATATTPSEQRARRAKSDEHYALKCRECDFTHDIPKDCVVAPAAFSVDVQDVRMQCVYGGAFTVTLGSKEFFTVAPVPRSGAVLHASIADNMKVLHAHVMSHCDPVFLSIRQTSNRTDHEYKRQPEGPTYVSISGERGVDIVGQIDVSKAEIPGVSW
jgi:hypothetical protein